MFYTYILYSESKDVFYVGQSDSIDNRLVKHLSGQSRYTSIANDWQLVYFEEFETRKEAISRERYIKRMKSRKYIQWLIDKTNSKD